jgi:hypothetical protein
LRHRDAFLQSIATAFLQLDTTAFWAFSDIIKCIINVLNRFLDAEFFQMFSVSLYGEHFAMSEAPGTFKKNLHPRIYLKVNSVKLSPGKRNAKSPV